MECWVSGGANALAADGQGGQRRDSEEALKMWTRGRIKEWPTTWLKREGRWPGVREPETLAESLAEQYTTGEGRWGVQPWMERVPQTRPLYLVTHGGMLRIHRDENEEKANAIARALNELETAMSK
jgi:hypothetical protein